MKRKIALVLAMIMLVGCMFVGCGKTAEPAESGRKVLRVAMECAYAPYNWTQNSDANGAVPIKDSNAYAYGYDVMMAKKIAEALDMDLEIYKQD